MIHESDGFRQGDFILFTSSQENSSPFAVGNKGVKRLLFLEPDPNGLNPHVPLDLRLVANDHRGKLGAVPGPAE